ncbi:MAG: zinc metallopeptidase [Bacteroidales bacterium]|nr:zinc metallopeptidase [Bacteroidales bacterium]
MYSMIWFIVLAVMAASALIQAVLNSKFKKYSKIPNDAGMTGAEIARKMLADNGIFDVTVTSVEGRLTDHYNPEDKTVNLSPDVFSGRSVAAAAVAAHECGHALQHAKGYAPLKMRSSLVPIVSFSSRWVSWLLLIGVLLVERFPAVLWAGIILFAMTTLFSFITLPVEINASSRAVKWLESSQIARAENNEKAVDALKWAAYTYVIAALGSLATLLYYISIASSRR